MIGKMTVLTVSSHALSRVKEDHSNTETLYPHQVIYHGYYVLWIDVTMIIGNRSTVTNVIARDMVQSFALTIHVQNAIK